MGKLKVGLIGGGGAGNFFGHVHKRAIVLDNSRELVAGALRSDPDAALEAAGEYDVTGYASYEALLEAVKTGEEKLDYVTIVTPNHAHYAPAKVFLEAGISVLCEKPMTMTVEEAEDLQRIVDSGKARFVLAHTYTGHPMMMFARELVASGKIGDVRKVEAWYNQGWLATALEEEGLQQAQWRTDPTRTGISNCGGDIGTHAFVAATWVSGHAVNLTTAARQSLLPRRSRSATRMTMASVFMGARDHWNGIRSALNLSSFAREMWTRPIGSAAAPCRSRSPPIYVSLPATTRTSSKPSPICMALWSA
jgi:predicted dehydrogenase